MINFWTRFYRDADGVRITPVRVVMTDAQAEAVYADITDGAAHRSGGELVWFTDISHPAHETVWVRQHPATAAACFERDSILGPELAAQIGDGIMPPLVARLEAAAAAVALLELPADGARAVIRVTIPDVDRIEAAACAMAFLADRPEAELETLRDQVRVRWPHPAVPIVLEMLQPERPSSSVPPLSPGDREPLLYLERPELLGLPRRPIGVTGSAS